MASKEYWEKVIKRIEEMPMEEFAELVKKVDEIDLPFAIKEEKDNEE